MATFKSELPEQRVMLNPCLVLGIARNIVIHTNINISLKKLMLRQTSKTV